MKRKAIRVLSALIVILCTTSVLAQGHGGEGGNRPDNGRIRGGGGVVRDREDTRPRGGGGGAGLEPKPCSAEATAALYFAAADARAKRAQSEAGFVDEKLNQLLDGHDDATGSSIIWPAATAIATIGAVLMMVVVGSHKKDYNQRKAELDSWKDYLK